MILQGKLYVESPIYRGNARKTLFTRDGDGTHRLVSLAGEISGTAQALMDAFIGKSKNGKNIGLINQMWQRLYGSPLPNNLIERVECKLQKESYPRNNFFDLRMGIRLDEDRWAIESNANYKMETLLRNSVFDLVMRINDGLLKKDNNHGKLYYVLQEITAGRFWFGAGKTKGLGRVRLDADLPLSEPDTVPPLHPSANHLEIDILINTQNPVLVGWNWGKVDPHIPSFTAVEAHLLIDAMKDIPAPIRDRLKMALGGAILNPEDWKKKFSDYLPRLIAIWLKEQSCGEIQSWVLPSAGLSKLSKGKHALTKKALTALQKLADTPFSDKDAAEAAIREALAKKANMTDRVMEQVEHTTQSREELNPDAWNEICSNLGLDKNLAEQLADKIQDEAGMVEILGPGCQAILPRLYDQVDQQIKLLQSDAWIDAEIKSREEHLMIKTMLENGKISEYQWNDPGMAPQGVRSATWREFLDAHKRVRFRHMLNAPNLKKSIANDKNHIEFLKTYREQTRQELSQPHHIDFRAGGQFNREISKKYGKPYDTIFMRMLTWKPSSKEKGSWEIYIPGSTIKGAFRKRASQVLKTLWGESRKTTWVLNRLFGMQGQRGLILFSDAYLTHPDDSQESWCSTDGIRMNPKTGQPIETSKRDYLFAYGNQLTFQCRLDIQDIEEKDIDTISLFFYLLEDFQNGDIPIGGEKTSGFGWTEAVISKLLWLTAQAKGMNEKLFAKKKLQTHGIWKGLELEGKAAADALKPVQSFLAEEKTHLPPQARTGFISHRAFGGYCGTLSVAAEVLTPINIQESGEPSFTTFLDDGPVNGFDFFSLSHPENSLRKKEQRQYALPGRSIRGMLRHIYTIVSDSRKESIEISKLNPADSLFGWVGSAPNQAIMGRLAFGFGIFEKPELAWFKVPYPYGDWHYTGGKWQNVSKAQAIKILIDNRWRVFPHAPIAPIAKQIKDFKPDTFQARYFRAMLPGCVSRFTIRFWNLTEEEFKRLLWSVKLDPTLAHKAGNNRYLGFGSLRLKILDDSFLIDWQKRYAGKDDWKLPLDADKFIDTSVIKHYEAIRQMLDASGVSS